MWVDTHWTSGVFDGDAPTGSIQRIESKLSANLNEVLDHLREIRDLTLAQTGLAVSDLAGAVLNIDAVLIEPGRALKSSVNPWLQQASVKDFSDALGCKVRLDLRIPTIVPELRARVHEGVRSLAVLNVDDGVSAHGMSIDPQWGAEVDYRGELGHVVVDPRGAICGCGRCGCLETLISGPAIIRRIEADIQAGTQTLLAGAVGKPPVELFAELQRLSELGADAYAITLVDEILEKVAWGVSLVMNLIGPDVIVLSGYVLTGRDRWRARVLEKARALTLYGETTPIRLEFPRLKPEDYLGELARSSHFGAPSEAS
jgi:predicted NBD/HSP70 family sugar kinase